MNPPPDTTAWDIVNTTILVIACIGGVLVLAIVVGSLLGFSDRFDTREGDE